MWVYLVEAVAYDCTESVMRKWNKKHRHNPTISAAVPRNKLEYKLCPTPDEFIQAIMDFIPWHHGCRLESINEPILLWLSVHGSRDNVGVKFNNGAYRRMYDLLSPLHKRLRHEVVLMQSICWGGYPAITFVMNRIDRGPRLTFGPTIEVDIAALHRAEHDTFKLLARHREHSIPAIKQHIGRLNKWGATHHAGHNEIYRAWYWEGHVHMPSRYPAPKPNWRRAK